MYTVDIAPIPQSFTYNHQSARSQPYNQTTHCKPKRVPDVSTPRPNCKPKRVPDAHQTQPSLQTLEERTTPKPGPAWATRDVSLPAAIGSLAPHPYHVHYTLHLKEPHVQFKNISILHLSIHLHAVFTIYCRSLRFSAPRLARLSPLPDARRTPFAHAGAPSYRASPKPEPAFRRLRVRLFGSPPFQIISSCSMPSSPNHPNTPGIISPPPPPFGPKSVHANACRHDKNK